MYQTICFLIRPLQLKVAQKGEKMTTKYKLRRTLYGYSLCVSNGFKKREDCTFDGATLIIQPKDAKIIASGLKKMKVGTIITIKGTYYVLQSKGRFVRLYH